MTLDALLNEGVVVDNNYFRLYINLIEQNRSRVREKYKCQKHHIIPVSYFKRRNIEVDNSPDNLIILLHKDHLLAHYYLYKCSVDGNFKRDNAYAIKYCLNNKMYKKSESYLNDRDIILNMEEYQMIMEETRHVSDETRLKHSLALKGKKKKPFSKEHRMNLSKAHKGKSPWNKGKPWASELKCAWVFKGDETISVKVSNLDYYLKLGYARGFSAERRKKCVRHEKRKPHSESTKKKIGEANRKNYTGKLIVNDGIRNYYIDKNELDDYLSRGFKHSRLILKKGV